GLLPKPRTRLQATTSLNAPISKRRLKLLRSMPPPSSGRSRSDRSGSLEGGKRIFDSLTTKRCLKDQIMPQPDHTVVIVGAGPTGLALGAELKRLGVSSLILDRLEAGANTSRAAVVHARTLEVLEPL